jgi:hypothetical protein
MEVMDKSVRGIDLRSPGLDPQNAGHAAHDGMAMARPGPPRAFLQRPRDPSGTYLANDEVAPGTPG